MALDSLAKRYAVLGIARPWMRATLPDAAKGSDWRASVANVYPVAAFSAPVVAETTNYRGFISNVNRLGLR